MGRNIYEDYDWYWDNPNFSATYNEDIGYISVTNFYDVWINFNDWNSVSAYIEDVSDVWIDTDAGGSWFKIVDSFDVHIQADQYGNSNNSFNVYDAWDVKLYATGGGNYARVDDADDVNINFQWGANTVHVTDIWDIDLTLGGTGDNWVKIEDADDVDAWIYGGDNYVYIDMQQSTWDGDDFTEDAVWLNFQGSRGHDTVRIYDADGVYVDTDGGYNDIYVNDSDDVRLNMDQANNGHNYIRVYNSDSLDLYSTGSENNIYAGNIGAWGEGDVNLDIDDGWNSIRLWNVEDDIDLDIGRGYNTINVNTHDFWGNWRNDGDSGYAFNEVRMNIDGDSSGGWGGNNTINVRQADYVRLDIDGGRNTIDVRDMDNNGLSDENVDIISGWGRNTVTLYDVDDVDFQAGFRFGAEGYNKLDIDDANDVHVAIKGGNNHLDMDDVNTVDVYAEGGSNKMWVEDALDVTTVFKGDNNTVDVKDANDVDLTLEGGGNNWVSIKDVDSLDGWIHGGDNYLKINMVDVVGSSEDVWLNFQGSRGHDYVDIDDADDVYIDTDGGYNTIKIDDANKVTLNLDQANNGHNTIHVDDADDVSVKTTGDYNTIDISDVDSLSMTLGEWGNAAGGHNVVTITDMDDSYGSENVWINVNDDGGGNNAFTLKKIDDVYIDTDGGGHNKVDIDDANHVNLNFDQSKNGWNDIDVNDALDVRIKTTEGHNTIDLHDIDEVDIETVGWSNVIDIDDAGDLFNSGDVSIHNTWGSSRYQDIDIDDADNVTIDMNQLNDSNIWVNDAIDVSINSYGSSTGSDNIINLGMGGGTGDTVDDVYVTLGGANNTVNVRSIESVDIDVADALKTDIQLDMGSGGQSDVEAYGTNVDVDIRGSSRDFVTVAGAYASVYTYAGDDEIWTTAGAADIDSGSGNDDVHVLAGGANINLGAGDDTLYAGALGTKVNAGDGNDTLYLGSFFANKVDAGAGDDRIYAGAFAQVLDAGEGNNTVMAAGGLNFINAGGGNDTVGALGGLNFVDVGGGDNTVIAGGAANLVFTEDGDDTVVALGGANVIWTEGGDDTVLVGGAMNFVEAGAGNDTVVGVGGGNILLSGAGNDTVVGVGGGNIITGGTVHDADSFKGAAENFWMKMNGDQNAPEDNFSFKTDFIFNREGTGDDTLIGFGAVNKILAGDGDDTAIAVGMENEVHGDAGKDFVLGLGAKNSLTGDEGNDIVIGAGASNQVYGGLGSDVLIAAGSFNIVGGDSDGAVGMGISTLLNTGKLIYNAVKNDPNEAFDYLAEMDDVLSPPNSLGDDTILAVGGANIILGGQGSDSIYAAGVGNVIYSGDQDDTMVALGATNVMFGGTGDDVFVDFSLKSQSYGGEGSDTFLGVGLGMFSDYAYIANDSLEGLESVYNVFESTMSDVFDSILDGLSDAVDWSGINDNGELDSAMVEFNAFINNLTGDINDGANQVSDTTSAAADTITPDAQTLSDIYALDYWEGVGNDILDGLESFGDTLAQAATDLGSLMTDALWDLSSDIAEQMASMVGNSGNDIFVSGFGMQTLSGGTGDDTYVFYEGEGTDVISDFAGPYDAPTEFMSGYDTLEYRLDASDPDSETLLGDLLFSRADDDFMITSGFTSTVVVDGQGEELGGIESLLLDYGGLTVDLDVDYIFNQIGSDETVSLADVLNVAQDMSFQELEDLLASEVDTTLGTIDGAAVDTADLSSLHGINIDDDNIDVV